MRGKFNSGFWPFFFLFAHLKFKLFCSFRLSKLYAVAFWDFDGGLSWASWALLVILAQSNWTLSNPSFSLQMRELEPTHYGLQLRKVVDGSVEWHVPALYEYMQEQASGRWRQRGTVPPHACRTSQPRLALNSLCSWGWSWDFDPPASTSWRLGIQMCATTPGVCDAWGHTQPRLCECCVSILPTRLLLWVSACS